MWDGSDALAWGHFSLFFFFLFNIHVPGDTLCDGFHGGGGGGGQAETHLVSPCEMSPGSCRCRDVTDDFFFFFLNDVWMCSFHFKSHCGKFALIDDFFFISLKASLAPSDLPGRLRLAVDRPFLEFAPSLALEDLLGSVLTRAPVQSSPPRGVEGDEHGALISQASRFFFFFLVFPANRPPVDGAFLRNDTAQAVKAVTVMVNRRKKKLEYVQQLEQLVGEVPDFPCFVHLCSGGCSGESYTYCTR